MADQRITRREALAASALALPLAAVSSATADNAAKAKRGMTVGMATTRFVKHTNAQLAEQLAAEGLGTVQLFLTQSDSNYWKYNGRSELAGLTAERCREIAAAYRTAGISIHSIGVYTNLIHPDEAERNANLAYFEAMMKVGRHMGVDKFITEAGHYHPEGPAPRVAYDFEEEVWNRTVATVKQLATLARPLGATVLIEPSTLSFFATAKRTRVFLEEVDSPHVRALLDPANLLEFNDLDEMFDQLTPWIDCLHAKDRKLHVVRGVAAGQGDLDYARFVTLATERTPKAPLILEYVGADDYRQSLAHLRSAMRQVGVSENR